MVTPENTQRNARLRVPSAAISLLSSKKTLRALAVIEQQCPEKRQLIITLTVFRRLEFIHDGMRLRVPRKIASDFALCKFN